jgi:hypothetical protein
MNPRMILVAFALLSQTGCVAALPMVGQLVSAPNSDRLCSMAKLPGQTTSLCERFGKVEQPQTIPPVQTPNKAPNGTMASTTVR